METYQSEINGIECLQVLGKDPGVGVIMLHGYGANMHDLYPLWELWHMDSLNWYFPNGIKSLNLGPYEGRAWFNIDVVALERAMREGKNRDLKSSIPPELDEVLSCLVGFVGQVAQKHKRIILGGFSQGAMCASHLVMKENLPIEGVILLSGALLAESKFPKTARPIPFYMSHGTLDPILSIEGARDLEHKLQSLHFPGKLHPFKGGHEIPSHVIQEVKDFLKEFIF
jgi:phospholipase/carboxylesterase